MPELPDVENFRRVLTDHATGTRIDDVDVRDAGVLRNVEAEPLRRALTGRVFASPRRHGKWLVAPLRSPRRTHGSTDPSVVFHFGMTGGLVWTGHARAGDHQHDRVVVLTRRGVLRYRDMRKLQGIRLVRTDDDVTALLSMLGPDAAGISRRALDDCLAGRRGRIKPALMDQTVVAGLGNLLVDEILWRTGVNPVRPVDELSQSQRRRLHQRMGSTVQASIRAGCVPARPSWLTGNRDPEGLPCPRCGTPLRRGRVGGRATVWCPSCQPG